MVADLADPGKWPIPVACIARFRSLYYTDVQY